MVNVLYRFYESEKTSKIKVLYVCLDIIVIIISLIPLMFFLDTKTIRVIEYATVSYFIVDYLLRMTISPLKYEKGFGSIFIYAFSFYAVIDILAIIPVFFAVNSGLKSLRLLRLIKTFRFLKIVKYSKSIDMIKNVFKKEAGLLVTVLSVALMFVFISALMIFQFEHDHQPDVFRTFFDAVWWAFATLTTVGYGDIYPVSVAGKIISIFVSFIGIAVVALPSGIIAAGFIDEYNSKKNNVSD